VTEFEYSATAVTTELLKCFLPPGCINRHGTKKVAQLCSAVSVEPAPGTGTQPSNVAKRSLSNRVVTVLKNEHWDPEDAQLTGQFAQNIRVFFHGITDKHQSVDGLALFCGV
jgi:hypothetical protein